MVSGLVWQWVEPGPRQDIWGQFRKHWAGRSPDTLPALMHTRTRTDAGILTAHSLFPPGLSHSTSSPAFTQKAQHLEGCPCKDLQREGPRAQQAHFAFSVSLHGPRRAYSLPLCIGPAHTKQPNIAGSLQRRSHSSLLTNSFLCCSGKIRLSWPGTKLEEKASLEQKS